MSFDDFEADLKARRADLASSRVGLTRAIETLKPEDFERARRGGWTVQRVLAHVIQSELLYTRVVLHLRGLPVPTDAIDATPASPEDALDRLSASRAGIMHAVDGVDEDAFYTLGQLGHEEYSVVSVLENAAAHDREHTAQITAIVSG